MIIRLIVSEKILLSETVNSATENKLIDVEQVESADPSVIMGIPRLAILHGLSFFKEFMLLNQKDNANFFFKENWNELVDIDKCVALLDESQYLLLQRGLLDSDSASPQSDQQVQDVYRKICQVADKLQSGQKAKFFVDILGKAFNYS